MPLVHAPFPFGFHWISCFHKLWCCFSWQFLRVSSQDLAQAGYVSSTCQNNRQHAKGSFRDAKKVASTCQNDVSSLYKGTKSSWKYKKAPRDTRSVSSTCQNVVSRCLYVPFWSSKNRLAWQVRRVNSRTVKWFPRCWSVVTVPVRHRAG